MSAIKEQVLREFGDDGAETLERYFVQLEYTVLWCIRMLYKSDQIEAIIPEGIEDVVILKTGKIELHQVKTRSESQGPWIFSDALNIICKQFHRRKAFSDKQCSFHFVSDGLADTRKSNAKQPDYPSSLYHFKHLLEIIHDGQLLSNEEKQIFDEFKNCLTPKIQQELKDNYNDDVDEKLVTELLYNTWIDTNSSELRKRDILSEIHNALVDNPLSVHQYTTQQLQNIHDQILLLVLRKILSTNSLEKRKITRDEVMSCRTFPNPSVNIDLDNLPGESVLEKKVYLGGFDITEIPIFNRQRKQADWTNRRLKAFGVDFELERLTTALLDLQSNSRNMVCRLKGVKSKPGPEILAMVRENIADVRQRIFPNQADVDDQFCLGILWNQTDECLAWWHGFEDNR